MYNEDYYLLYITECVEYAAVRSCTDNDLTHYAWCIITVHALAYT